MLRRAMGIVVASVIVSGLATGTVAAQRFAGRVVGAATGAPLPGAVVQVLDAAGLPVATALSGTGGAFRVQGTFASPVTVVVDMIGHARWSSPPWTLGPADSALLDVRMEVQPLPLEGLRAESASRCRAGWRASPATQELWRDVETALRAEQLSGEAGRHRFRLETFERDFAPGDSLVTVDRRTVRSSRDPEGFRSAPDSVLLSRGFLEERDDGDYLLGPTSAVLLAPWFLDTHCLAPAPVDERQGLIGLRFTPNEARRVPEIAGTIWVDATTRDLRAIDYRYVSLPRRVPAGAYRGDVAFQRLEDGTLFIRQWTISTPIVEVGEIVAFNERREVERDGGRHESGGEVLTTTAGADTLYRALRATLTGLVADSTAAPLAGARVLVMGTPYEATTDSAGRYRIGELPDGRYRIQLSHPRLTAAGDEPDPVAVALTRGATTTVDLLVPPEPPPVVTEAEHARLDTLAAVGRGFGLDWDLRRQDAAARASAADAAALFGRVVDAESGRALADASVRVGDRLVATDAQGRFAVRDLRPGGHRIAIEMLGYAERTGSVALEAGAAYDVDVRLSRRPIELDPIAVTVRSPALERAGFYERITSGLAPHVITAADIERRGWDRLADAFYGLPNVRVEQAGFSRRIVRMMRGPASGLGASTTRALPGCEPALYIDGQIHRDRVSSNPDELWVEDWNVLPPLVIEAIEIYSGANTPVEYPHACGVVLVWTRR